MWLLEYEWDIPMLLLARGNQQNQNSLIHSTDNGWKPTVVQAFFSLIPKEGHLQ